MASLRRSQFSISPQLGALGGLVRIPQQSIRIPQSDYERERIFDELSDRLQEFGSGRAVDDAVIAAHGDAHALPHLELAIDHHRLRLYAADGDNPGFWRIDDRGE